MLHLRDLEGHDLHLGGGDRAERKKNAAQLARARAHALRNLDSVDIYPQTKRRWRNTVHDYIDHEYGSMAWVVWHRSCSSQ